MSVSTEVANDPTFLEELRIQRWDDHRFYHQSRVNQTLHLFSASCFLMSYVLVAYDPLAAAVLGWVVAMWSRQIGHFFFEPKGFDRVNQMTFDHKESVKVGFNLQRKVVLLVVWAALPLVLWIDPTFFGTFAANGGTSGWHSHPGPSLIFVVSGTVTNYMSDGHHCTQQEHTAGQGFVDEGGDMVHMVKNNASGAAIWM